MRTLQSLYVAALAAALLAACGDNVNTGAIFNPNGGRGSLIQNPPLRIATLTARDFAAQLNATPSGQQLLALSTAGTPTPGQLTCGVDFHYIQYGTVDGGNPQAPTAASGALMVPTGAAPACSGPRPMLLYAHGTATDRNTNLADITNPNNTEGALIAAMFAAQGFIVVAPNYAGYDSSPLPYHPFLNADQQSKEMIDALTAARLALPKIFASGTTDAGLLFVTGYSEGGHVAMATHKAMQALQGTTPSLRVTASAPMSGPYATSSFGDALIFGNVNLGSTVFAPLITTSYQRAFGNIYTATTDVYETTFATGIDALLPSVEPLSALFAPPPRLPQTFLFNSTTPVTGNAALDAALAVPSNPLFAIGFGTPNLITNNYRVAYALDAVAHPDGVVPTVTTGLPPATTGNTLGGTLRGALKANDMRSWVPTAPVLLCGGHQDPTVFYPVNTTTMQGFWTPQLASPTLLTVVDVDPAPATTAPPGTPQAVFLTAQAAVFAAGGQQAVVQAYHGTLVPPACAVTVQGFFKTILSSTPIPFP